MATIAENLIALKQGKDDMNTALEVAGANSCDYIGDIATEIEDIPLLNEEIEKKSFIALLSNGADYPDDTEIDVVIPKDVTSLPQYWLYSNNTAGIYNLNGKIRLKLWNVLAAGAFTNVTFNNDVFVYKPLTNFGIQSVTYNGKVVFKNIETLLKSNTALASNGKLYIRDTKLSDIIVPKGIESIYANLFSGYDQLSGCSVYIPQSVDLIMHDAFWGTGIADVYINSTTPPTLQPQSTTYQHFPLTAKIHVPKGYAETYKTAWTEAAQTGTGRKPGVTLDNIFGDLEDVCDIDEIWPPKQQKSLRENIDIAVSSNSAIRSALVGKGINLSDKYWGDYDGEIAKLHKITGQYHQSYVNYLTHSGIVEIPEGCKTLSRASFMYKGGITKIIIPASVTSIDYLVSWVPESALNEISVHPNNNVYTSRNGSDEECNCVMTKAASNKTLLWGTNQTKDGTNGSVNNSIVIPNGVVTITSYAFINRDLKNRDIYFPSTLTTMGHFSSNGAYSFVDKASGVFKAHFNSLMQVCGLIVPTIAASWAGSNWNLYISDTQITALDFETYNNNYPTDQISEIKERTFGLSTITSLVLGGVGSMNIKSTAFKYCSALQQVTVNCPVVANGFSNNAALTNIYYAGIATLYACSGSGFFPDTASPNRNIYVNGALKTIVDDIPSNVTSLSPCWFSGATCITKVDIPNNITEIANNTFKFCTSLSSVTGLESVTSIGSQAFWGCTSLTSIALPSTITSIAMSAFNQCTNLTTIKILAEDVPSLGNINAFPTASSCKIYVPDASLGDYRGATNWKSIASRILPLSQLPQPQQ